MCISCEKKLNKLYEFFLQVKTNLKQLSEKNIEDCKEIPVFVKVETKVEPSSDEFIEENEHSNTSFDLIPLEINDQSQSENEQKIPPKKRSRKSNLETDISQTEIDDPKYDRGTKICPICGKIRDKRNFKRHLKTHEKEKIIINEKIEEKIRPYTCDICDYKTTSKGYVKQHIDSKHLKISKKICELCGVAFSRTRDMQLHKIRHHQERTRQKCEDCGKYFLDLYAHWSHNHRKEGIFICTICGREFDNKRRLSGHISKTHRRIECKECGGNYKNGTALKEHMHQKHLNAEPLYSCSFCDFKGNYRKNFKAHLKRLHPKEHEAFKIKHTKKFDKPEIPALV